MTYGGNNFSDFPDNQLTIDFAFLCMPTRGNTNVSPFLTILILFGGTEFPKKVFGERRNMFPPRFPSTTPLMFSLISPLGVCLSVRLIIFIHHNYGSSKNK